MVLNTTMVTPAAPEGANQATKKSFKTLVNNLREKCERIRDPVTNAVLSQGPGLAVSPNGKVNANGLDGVIEIMRTQDFQEYIIKNENTACIAKASTVFGSAPKLSILDSDPASPTDGFSPVGDPTFSWLQSQNEYCQAGRGAENPTWMYENYPCTEILTKLVDSNTRREF